MKSLTESLFDDKLIEKDVLENPDFKKWINRPDTLWFLYEYWADDMDDPLEDFMPNEWHAYKETVDYILDRINQKTGNMWPMYRISYDAADYNEGLKDSFDSEEEYTDEFNDALYEIQHKSTEEVDGIYKTWFKGSMPKNSNVTYFLKKLPDEGRIMTKPGYLAGGFFLAEGDENIMVWGFPRSLDKNILALFNIK